MNAHEHTDPHGDGLTITHDDGKVWITCTTAHAEVTVGPLAPGILADHDMDGGVTAALIEKEAEQATGEHDRGFMEAAAHDWSSVAVRASGEALAADARARRAESALDDLREQYGTAVREKDEWEANAEAAEARAEQAERERDEAREDCNDALRREKAEQDRANKARRERDAAVDSALFSAESRPLTPDAITNEMVGRGYDALMSTTKIGVPFVRELLTAALIEPPARPEGAEEWEDWLIEALPHESMQDEEIARLADRIAAHLTEKNGDPR